MAIDREKLKALALAATPGPWRASAGNGVASVLAKDCAVYMNVDKFDDMQASHARWAADAAFIAAVNPTTILALLAEIGELEKERDGYRDRPWERLREMGFQVDEGADYTTLSAENEKLRARIAGYEVTLLDARQQRDLARAEADKMRAVLQRTYEQMSGHNWRGSSDAMFAADVLTDLATTLSPKGDGRG